MLVTRTCRIEILQKDTNVANRRDGISNTQTTLPEFIKFDIEDAKQPAEHIRKHVERYRERELKNQQSPPIVSKEQTHERRSNITNKTITKSTITASSTESSILTKAVNHRWKSGRRSSKNESSIDRIQKREINIEDEENDEGDMEMMHSRHRRIYAVYPSHSRGNNYNHYSNPNQNPMPTPHYHPYMQVPRKSLNKLPMEVQKTISYIMKDKYYTPYPKYESGGSVKYLTLDKATAFQPQHHLQQQPNELKKIKIVYIPQYTYPSSTPTPSYVQQYTTPSPVVSTTLASPVKLSPLIQKTSPVLSAAPSIVLPEPTSTQIKLAPDINYGVIHEIPAPILYNPDNDNKNNKYVSDNDLDSANSIAPQSNIQQTQNNYIKYVYKNPEKYELLRGENVGNLLDPSYSYIFSKPASADLKPQRPQDNTAPILFHPNTTQAPDIDYSTAASTTKDYSYNSHTHKDYIPITENEETSYSSTPSSLSILPTTSKSSFHAENSEENEFHSFEENNSNVIHITPSPYPHEASLEDESLSSSPVPSPLLSYSSEEKAETAIKPLETIEPSSQSHHAFAPSIDTLVSIYL